MAAPLAYNSSNCTNKIRQVDCEADSGTATPSPMSSVAASSSSPMELRGKDEDDEDEDTFRDCDLPVWVTPELLRETRQFFDQQFQNQTAKVEDCGKRRSNNGDVQLVDSGDDSGSDIEILEEKIAVKTVSLRLSDRLINKFTEAMKKAGIADTTQIKFNAQSLLRKLAEKYNIRQGECTLDFPQSSSSRKSSSKETSRSCTPTNEIAEREKPLMKQLTTPPLDEKSLPANDSVKDPFLSKFVNFIQTNNGLDEQHRQILSAAATTSTSSTSVALGNTSKMSTSSGVMAKTIMTTKTASNFVTSGSTDRENNASSSAFPLTNSKRVHCPWQQPNNRSAPSSLNQQQQQSLLLPRYQNDKHPPSQPPVPSKILSHSAENSAHDIVDASIINNNNIIDAFFADPKFSRVVRPDGRVQSFIAVAKIKEMLQMESVNLNEIRLKMKTEAGGSTSFDFSNHLIFEEWSVTAVSLTTALHLTTKRKNELIAEDRLMNRRCSVKDSFKIAIDRLSTYLSKCLNSEKDENSKLAASKSSLLNRLQEPSEETRKVTDLDNTEFGAVFGLVTHKKAAEIRDSKVESGRARRSRNRSSAPKYTSGDSSNSSNSSLGSNSPMEPLSIITDNNQHSGESVFITDDYIDSPSGSIEQKYVDIENQTSSTVADFPERNMDPKVIDDEEEIYRRYNVRFRLPYWTVEGVPRKSGRYDYIFIAPNGRRCWGSKVALEHEDKLIKDGWAEKLRKEGRKAVKSKNKPKRRSSVALPGSSSVEKPKSTETQSSQKSSVSATQIAEPHRTRKSSSPAKTFCYEEGDSNIIKTEIEEDEPSEARLTVSLTTPQKKEKNPSQKQSEKPDKDTLPKSNETANLADVRKNTVSKKKKKSESPKKVDSPQKSESPQKPESPAKTGLEEVVRRIRPVRKFASNFKYPESTSKEAVAASKSNVNNSTKTSNVVSGKKPHNRKRKLAAHRRASSDTNDWASSSSSWLRRLKVPPELEIECGGWFNAKMEVMRSIVGPPPKTEDEGPPAKRGRKSKVRCHSRG